MGAQRRLHLGDLVLAPDEAADCRPQVARTRIQRPQRRKLRAHAGRSDLKHPHRDWQVAQPARPQIQQLHSAEQHRRRLGQQDLTTVPGGHHPGGTVQHRTEIVRPPQLGFAGRDPHPHRQLQCPLRSHRRVHRTPGPGIVHRGMNTKGVNFQPSKRSHFRPCPQLDKSPAISRDVFMQVDTDLTLLTR